ncbi:unnamed protein product [marine sediment metagenome]|uniref:Uncharacterized protein n=1 Tax=marine sediment metagenome TaxID=412755 RepID=X0SPV3_9ZZZZ
MSDDPSDEDEGEKTYSIEAPPTADYVPLATPMDPSGTPVEPMVFTDEPPPDPTRPYLTIRQRCVARLYDLAHCPLFLFGVTCMYITPMLLARYSGKLSWTLVHIVAAVSTAVAVIVAIVLYLLASAIRVAKERYVDRAGATQHSYELE